MPESAAAPAIDPKPQRPAQKTYTLAELLQLEFKEGPSIIGNGLLNRNSIMVVAAPPKSYKSFSTNTLLAQLLIGGNLFKVTRSHARSTEHLFPITPVERVLLIEQEIGLQDTRDRLREFHTYLTLAEQQIVEQRLFVRSCDYDLRLDREGGIAKIAAIIEQVRPNVVCFDPLTKFHTSDENSPSEMGRIMLALRQLIHKYDITVIILHHTGKNEEGKTTLDMLRGASTIAADIDTGMILHVVNRSASIIWIDIELRRGKPIPPFQIKLNHQTLHSEFHKWCKGKSTYQLESALAQGQASDETEQ